MERNCEPMDKDWIGGVAEQSERGKFREALVSKAKRRAVKESVLHLGLVAERPTWKGGARRIGMPGGSVR